MTTKRTFLLVIFYINHMFLLFNKKTANDNLFNTFWELEYPARPRIAFEKAIALELKALGLKAT